MRRLSLAQLVTVFMFAILLFTTPFQTLHAGASKKDKGKGQSEVTLRIMETTDIHMNLLSYDYYKNSESPNVGLAKTATLIKQARKEVKNSVLVDNGDLIQGNPFATYKAILLAKKKFIQPSKR